MRVLSSQEAFQYTTNLFPWYLSASINELAPERVRDYKATGVSGSTPMIDTSEYQRPALTESKHQNAFTIHSSKSFYAVNTQR